MRRHVGLNRKGVCVWIDGIVCRLEVFEVFEVSGVEVVKRKNKVGPDLDRQGGREEGGK